MGGHDNTCVCAKYGAEPATVPLVANRSVYVDEDRVGIELRIFEDVVGVGMADLWRGNDFFEKLRGPVDEIAGIETFLAFENFVPLSPA